MKNFLIILFLLICCTAFSQEHLYVNTDNLILRDRPEKVYNVFAILHAGCELDLRHTDKGYANDKAVTGRFYQVSFTYWKDDGTSLLIGGWVEKRYIVLSRHKITVHGTDTTLRLSATVVDDDPEEFNYGAYPPPKYKGGEKRVPVAMQKNGKRVYHTGPRGGCYYKDPRGHKRYVDPKLCK